MRKIYFGAFFGFLTGCFFTSLLGFEGFSFGLGIASSGSSCKRDPPFSEVHYSRHSFDALFEASYSRQISDSWSLGLGIAANPKKQIIKHDRDDIDYSSLSLRNRYAVFVEPLYRLDEKTALFGRVSYHRAHISVRSPRITVTTSQGGTGLDLGIKRKLSSRVFIQLSAQYVQYRPFHALAAENSWLDAKIKQASGQVCLGFQI